jgi:four helix bundle protein
MGAQSYRDLDVWKRSIDLIEAVYGLTRSAFPQDERFGLTSQIQRAAVSVAANIAEGNGRVHRGDYVHHLSISRGSLCEVETYIVVAARLNIATREQLKPVWSLTQQVGQMLTKLISSLR